MFRYRNNVANRSGLGSDACGSLGVAVSLQRRCILENLRYPGDQVHTR